MPNTSLPSQSAFVHAVLEFLSGQPEAARRSAVHEAMPDLLNLSEAQRNDRLANLPHLRYRHRSGWGLSMLKAAGYVDNLTAGLWQINARGRELLHEQPKAFDQETYRRLIRESRAGLPGSEVDADSETSAGTVLNPALDSASTQTPEERIEQALAELRTTVARQLLERVLEMPPAFFETLVLDVLHGLGYGSSHDDLQRVGGSGDGGIDGIISLDRLGLDKVYVQAKRWRNSVGRPDIQAFCGALSGRRAAKGVFITTSVFTREATDFILHASDSITLIDGARLTSLMIDCGVGVAYQRTIKVPRIDTDYFEAD